MAAPFHPVVYDLVCEIEGLRSSIRPLVELAGLHAQLAEYALARFLEQNGELVRKDGAGKSQYSIRPADFRRLLRLDRKLKSSSMTQSLLPGSLLVTLVSRFDAFLGRLIKSIVLTCPELLATSERTLPLSTLLELGSFETARDYLIEKEIEAVLRKSHAEHFEWLEGKLDISLRKGLDSWPAFIELTERRNLLVHADGIVSHQYLANCRRHGANVDGQCVGARLDVPPEYYQAACDCILEIAVKLTHVVWRKLVPNDREDADNALVETCYDLLVREHFRVANVLLRFAVDVLKRHASEKHRLTFVVNLAQSHKWLGDETACASLLVGEDWSAKDLSFRLCVAVLRDKPDDMVRLMKEIGGDGCVKAGDYREWPVFRNVRAEPSFQQCYKEVFGEDMRLDESVNALQPKDLMEFFETVVEKSMRGDPSVSPNSHSSGEQKPASGPSGNDGVRL